jgi:hypothetical protein
VTIKAIETVYKGHRFRSRLEARWAVFFDSLGIKYQYELEGFECDEGGRYLPDFYLPDSQTWVEVKGDAGALRKDWSRMADLLDFGGVLPHFADSAGSLRGLLLLGDVPYIPAGSCAVVAHPIIQHRKGLLRSWVVFSDAWLHAVCDGVLASLCGLDVEIGLEGGPAPGWVVESRVIYTPRFFPRASAAYTAARGARFEHGQVGAPAEWAR